MDGYVYTSSIINCHHSWIDNFIAYITTLLPLNIAM